jgi:hypothetical protein
VERSIEIRRRSMRRRRRAGLRGEYGAELQQGIIGWMWKERMANEWVGRGWGGGEEVEVCEGSPRSAGGHASAATSLSSTDGSVASTASSAAPSLSRSSSSALAAAGSSNGSRMPLAKNATLPQHRARTISASGSSATPKSMVVDRAGVFGCYRCSDRCRNWGAGSGSESASNSNRSGTARKMEFYTRLLAAPRPLHLDALALNSPPSVSM